MSAIETTERFSIAVSPTYEEVAVMPTGDVDLATAEDVADTVRELRDAGFDAIVLDLRGVDFLDSVGLRMLLDLRNAAMRSRHRLTLVPGPAKVQRLFELTGTRGLFDWR